MSARARLEHKSPASVGVRDDGSPLPSVGRAERRALGRGELWIFARAYEPVAGRLRRLGDASVGGFTDGGIDGERVWLLRSALGTPLAEAIRSRKGPWPWHEAAMIARSIAQALVACEQASLFAGPLTPDAIVIGDDATVVLPASALVAAMCGASDASGRAPSTAPLWTPPEQAAGAAWDASANRRALGLVLYRLLAGEHPFAGAGLRHALDEAARGVAPPFKESVAAELPAGLQSFCLRVIESGTRDAATLVAELDGFLQGKRVEASNGQHATPALESRVASSPVVRSRTPTPRSTPSVTHAWPIVGGLAVAVACLAAVLTAGPRAPPPATIALAGEEAPLTEAHVNATDCARCHPRQAAEWRRSVMAHSVKSPVFNALESLIEEQVGRDDDCPNGAGILRKVNPTTACRAGRTGNVVTGSGGEHWCVNCHSPNEKLEAGLPAWDGRAAGDARTRRPVRDLLGDRGMEGISCSFCHEVHGAVPTHDASRGRYEGNATWTSFITGATFVARPEDLRGLPGIGNSGYEIAPADFLDLRRTGSSIGAHLPESPKTHAYLRSSEFCGSCHDVRLFGTDVLGASRGEHFKRLRNAYSEWAAWSRGEARSGRTAASCQACHMSQFPGVCVPNTEETADPLCPLGYRFSPREPGQWPKGRVATASAEDGDVTTHWFSGVDLPLSRELPTELLDEKTVDVGGIPLSPRHRRDALLKRTFRFALGTPRRGGRGVEIPVEIENVGAGHRVPAGFSQEREIWVHLVVEDGDGRVVYEVGRVDRGDEDLRDKVFARVNVRGDERDGAGRPLGLFGADVRDGPDVPAWQPPPSLGGTSFRGSGLVSLQNGFLRCVRCLGTVAPNGRCEAGPGQDGTRAARFADGDYDLDTGACRSNLTGDNALFETYFPVGALDASRGVVKGPDAIIDTRSLPPRVPVRYVYDLPTSGRRGPLQVRATLLFRAFPPFLVKAFAAYEREQARRGLRPSGPLVDDAMLTRLEVVELAAAEAVIP